MKNAGEQERQRPAETIGLALGAGGAKGLAHILMLEALDELGVKPAAISGSSFGAVIGTLYASGLSGKEIREFIDALSASRGRSWPEALFRKDITHWIDFIDPVLGKGGLIDGENFIQYLQRAIRPTRFEELDTRLRLAAADFWQREQIVLDSGPLLPAVKASMALPGLFTPVTLKGRVLVDGGTVNPVPYDLLDDCDLCIAIDVMGANANNGSPTPAFFDVLFNTIHIMQRAILLEKLKRRPPGIYIRPEIAGVRMLEFYRTHMVYTQAAPAKEELKRELEKRLDNR